MSMGVSKGQKCLESLWIVLVSIIILTYFETKTSVEIKIKCNACNARLGRENNRLQLEECWCSTTNIFSNFQVLS